MSINPLKEFFRRRKAEVKFARAGPGQKLSSDSTSNPGPSSEQASARQAAAEAAMKRFSKDNTKPSQRPKMMPRSQPASEPSSAPQTTPTSSEVPKSKPELPKDLPIVDGQPQRDVKRYSTEELAQRAKQPDIDDDFFRLTVEDAKLFKQRYDEERARNEILKTSEMRRREAEARQPTTNVARLRFKLPNNMVLEASFSGSETLNIIRDWLVAICLERENLQLSNFDILFGFKPFKATDYEKTVKQLGLVPASTLTVILKAN